MGGPDEFVRHDGEPSWIASVCAGGIWSGLDGSDRINIHISIEGTGILNLPLPF